MSQPEKRFRCGCCETAIFENEITKNGLAFSVKKVAIQKRYKNNDEWKSTHSLDTNDIPKMTLALSKAYEYLTISTDVAAEEL